MKRQTISEEQENQDAERPFSLKLALRIFASTGPYKWLVFLGCVLVVICVFADLEMINQIGKLVNRDDLMTAPLFELIIPFIILALINRVTGWSQWVLASYAGIRSIADLRKNFFVKLQALSKGFYDTHKSGWLVARCTGDMGILLDFVTFCVMMLGVFVAAIGMAVVRIAQISPILLLPCILTVPAVATLSFWYKRRMSKVQRFARKKNSDLVANMAESVKGIRVVQAFSRERQNLDVFNKLNMVSHDTEIRIARLNALYLPTMDMIGLLNTTIVVAFGSYLIHYGSGSILSHALTPGDLVSYILFMNVILMPIRMMVDLYSMSLRAMAAAERIFEIIDAEPEIMDSADPVVADSLEGRITFDHVSFRYGPDEPPVLQDFSLDIEAGETVALVGETGAGKTTVAGLISRFYDVTEGSVLIDGIDVRNYSQDSLHENMGIVPQEGFLFTGTVLDNLRLRAPDMTATEIENVARRVGTHDAILSLPDGYNTSILESGGSMSEGQRQLLSITRALAADPRILVLDEPTSSLDVNTESILQKALDELFQDRTTIVIAHRLSTVRRADRIVVLDKGRIVETGNHDSLIGKKGAYYRYVLQSEGGREKAEG
ncbi:MAG: ABC transporter ATP-binding protein [Kiritimatiellae bacterium]|nr:ABC transporter ATP-binding protein [Kiritimatiellia bacterium]